MLNEPRDMGVSEGAIREFLEAVARRLQVRRSKVTYGKDESEHLFFTGALADGTTESQHVVVVVAVQRSEGGSRVLFRAVRQPSQAESTELGVAAQPPWSDALVVELGELFLRELSAAKDELGVAVTLPVFRRFLLAYTSIRGLSGEYWVGPWRIGPPVSPPDGTMWGEKILLCDRMLPAGDPFAMRQEVERLALLLSVFWLHLFHTTAADEVWILNEFTQGQELESRMAQRGYADGRRASVLPARGEISPVGGYRDVDRLDAFAYGIFAGEPFVPPSDSPLLFKRFYEADANVAERFLAACKVYEIAENMATTNVTAAISYLVDAAESLIETKWKRCESCGQLKGIARAARDLFFNLLPCLEQQRAETEAFLKSVYSIRSLHFHDAEFVAGELEPWYSTQFLLPASFQAGTTLSRMRGLVNGALVAWLMRQTGEAWQRAAEPPPRIREPKYFSVSGRLGPPPAGSS